MFPVLSFGGLALPTYPLFTLIALWAGMWLFARRANQLGLEGDHAYNAGLYGLISGLLGARIWFVLSHWENYAPDITQAFSLSRSALSAKEGFIVAAVAVFVYVQVNKLPVGRFVDALATGLALAVIIGHFGAFLGGEGLGRPALLTWSVEIAGVARHPVQMYKALGSLIVLLILYLNKEQQPWPSFQFWLFVILYSAMRLPLEIFQARPQLIGGGFLAVQVMSLVIIVIAMAVMAYNFTNTVDSETATTK